MTRNLSNAMQVAMNAQETGEVVLPLVKLTQSDWDDAICLVPNTAPITHGGDTYQPMAFEISLPDEKAEGIPVINWRIDNVDQTLVKALRNVKGAVNARLVYVLASDPEHIQFGPLEVNMYSARYNAREVSGTLSLENILPTQFGAMVMNPLNAPGLF